MPLRRLWRLTDCALLHRQHARATWSAVTAGTRVVVKCLPVDTGWQWELAVADRLAERGWPVPRPLADARPDGPHVWLLLSWLPGGLDPGTDPAAERRRRGRLIADLHADLADAVDLGQRPGFALPAEVVSDARLAEELRAVPDAGARELLGYRDAARAWFADRPPPTVAPVHGDVAAWNVLVDGRGRLTGLLDFEASHLAYPVSDFGCAWRGCYDDVIRGYEQVRPLSAAEWNLLVPAWWAWLFLGVADDLAAARIAGRAPDLSWPLAHARRRSELVRERVEDAQVRDALARLEVARG